MTKLLIVTQYFYPENFRINEVVNLVKNHGWSVDVFTSYPSYPNKNKYRSWSVKSDVDIGISIYRFPSWRRSTGSNVDIVMHYLTFLLSIFFIPIIFFGKKYDFVFCYQPSPVTTGIVSLLISKYLSCKNIIWVQDLWPDSIQSKLGKKNSIIYKITLLIATVIYNFHDYIFCQSVGIKNVLERRISSKKVFYLPNFCESVYSKVESKFKFSDKFNIVFTGNIGESQDFRTILKALNLAVKINVSIHLTIVGDGRYKDTLIEDIVEMGISNHITLKPSCNLEQVIKYYELADVMLVSLAPDAVFSITIPGKIQSYLMAGKPIIGCINGEANSLINKNHLGIAVCSGDFKSLSNAIIEMSKKNSFELNEISKKCKSYYYANFDSKLFMEKLCNIIGG